MLSGDHLRSGNIVFGTVRDDLPQTPQVDAEPEVRSSVAERLQSLGIKRRRGLQPERQGLDDAPQGMFHGIRISPNFCGVTV